MHVLTDSLPSLYGKPYETFDQVAELGALHVQTTYYQNYLGTTVHQKSAVINLTWNRALLARLETCKNFIFRS